MLRPMHGSDAKSLMTSLPANVVEKLHAMHPNEVAELFCSSWEKAQRQMVLERTGYVAAFCLLAFLAYSFFF